MADEHQLTQQTRNAVRRFPWGAMTIGAAGASAIGLLGAAGLAPLLAAVGVGALSQGELAQWLVGLGGNVIAGWVGDLALWAAGKPLASDDPAEAQTAQQELAARLDALLAQDARAAGELARLLQAIDALPQSLAAIQEEVGAQSDVLLTQYNLLRELQADLSRLGLQAGALGPALVQEADRVIATLETRADRTDARLDTILVALQTLRDEQRQALISISGQTGPVSIGDVAGQNIFKAGGNIVFGDQIVEPFTPRSVAATPEELADATARLLALPTDDVPEPEDVLPPGSWMAQLRRNHQFVGREADLRTLAMLLKGGQSVAVNQTQSAVASGLGGIGKTQLAIEFAYRYGRYFAGVFWLSFAQPETIPAEIARLGGAAHLQLFTEAAGLQLDEQAGLVRARLACGLPYLLIFDNCEDPGLVREHHPGGATRVLITSRRPDWPSDLGVQGLALGVLNRDESIALLRQHRLDLSDTDADALAKELGDLPLALHLAGRFLAGIGKNILVARYLEELRSPRIFARLPLREQDGQLPTGHNRDVARTFALSYERLSAEDTTDALALRLLARAAYLVPGEVISANLLQATLGNNSDDLDAQLEAAASLERLVGLGLLDREADDGLRMHRLVGVYVRQASHDETAQTDVERVVVHLAGELSNAPTLTPIASFLPILRGVTDAALYREDEGAARLCLWLGYHLDRLGVYAPAQPYLEWALGIHERVLGAEHPDTASSLNNLAYLYQSQGNYEAARPLYERALAIQERVLGAEHPDTASSLNNLAGLLESQGNYEAARPLYERALAIQERVLGAEHPDTASSLNNLAGLLESQGNYEAARPLYERALAIQERVLGAEHPDTASSLNNLALLYHAQGNYEAARPLYERALAIQERVLGAEHPDTATSLNNLAILYQSQGNYEAARPLYERALALRERVLGAEHPQTASSLNNLAGLYRAQGNYEAARPLYERALALRERVLGAEHPDTATSLNNLALLYHAQGNYEAARPLYERALAIQERVLGAEHPQTASSLNNLAILYQSQGNYEAARPLYERALAIQERVLGAEHPQTASSLNNLAVLHAYRGDFDLALPLIERALQIQRRALGPMHPDTLGTEQSLANMRQATAQQQAPMGNPLERLAPLLTAIAIIATGDEAQRQTVAQTLVQLEQQGWMLRRPVERIWAGERDRDALVDGLDEQDTALIERVLTLVGEYERGERETPAQTLAAMPDAIRVAIETGDGATLMAALGALPEDERQAIIARLVHAGVVAAPPPRQPSADEQQIAELRAQAEQAVAQVLAGGDEQQRAALAAQLEQVAQQVAQQEGDEWQELAAWLREQAGRLG